MKNHWINKWNKELDMPDIRSQRFWEKLKVPAYRWDESAERQMNPENLVLSGIVRRNTIESKEIYHESLVKKASI